MKNLLTETSLDIICEAITNGTPEQNDAYFNSLKVLPDGEAIIQQVNHRLISDIFDHAFKTKENKGEESVDLTSLIAQSTTPPKLDVFMFTSDTEADEEECFECDCHEDEEEDSPLSELGFSIFMNQLAKESPSLEVPHSDNRLARSIRQQVAPTQEVSLSDLIAAAVNEEQPTEAVEPQRSMNSTLASRAIKEQLVDLAMLNEKKEAQDRLTTMINDTLTMMHSHSSSANLVFSKEEITETLLDSVTEHVIKSGLIADELVISDSAIELYEYYFQNIFYAEVFQAGLDESYQYLSTFTAYIMTELAQHYVNMESFELAFDEAGESVYPVLKAKN